jgi:ATP-dependent protease HslVU (ClpYQ) peptidase subunit
MDSKEAERLTNVVRIALDKEVNKFIRTIRFKSEKEQLRDLGQYVGLTMTALTTVLAHCISNATNFENMLEETQEHLRKYSWEFHKDIQKKRNG